MDELPKLEGKALVAGNFFEISTTCAVERGGAICRGSIILSLGLALTAILRSGRCSEANLIGYDLGNVSLLSLLIGPVSCLQATANNDTAAFLEIAGYKLSLLSPGNYVDEVNRLLTLIRFGITAVNTDREAANGNSACGLLELGIRCHMSHQDDLI
jgi:hypothetical protein